MKTKAKRGDKPTGKRRTYVTTSVRVDLLERLYQERERTGIPISWYINKALESYLVNPSVERAA